MTAHRDRSAGISSPGFDPTPEPFPPRVSADDLAAAAASILVDAPKRRPEDRLASALMETQLLASEFRALSGLVAPNLRWRCERASGALSGLLASVFQSSGGLGG